MKSYRSPKAELRTRSAIEGRGLFAKSSIDRGEIVAIKAGRVLSLGEYNALDDTLKKYCLQIDDTFFLGPEVEEEVEDSAIFINHSCEPNVGFEGQIIYVALRNIEPEEELCHDYAMSFVNRGGAFECSCGSKCCRGRISDEDWKLKELQLK